MGKVDPSSVAFLMRLLSVSFPRADTLRRVELVFHSRLCMMKYHCVYCKCQLGEGQVWRYTSQSLNELSTEK